MSTIITNGTPPASLIGKTIVPRSNRRKAGARRKVTGVTPSGRYIKTEPASGSGRKSVILVDRLPEYELVTGADAVRAARAAASKTEAIRRVQSAAPLTERERELLRIIKAKFSDFHHRNQHFYLLQGMSTTHVGWSMFADADAVRLFWPKELIKHRFTGTSYVMEGQFGRRIQAAVTETLKTLHEKGHLEKLGNKDERRWKPTYL